MHSSTPLTLLGPLPGTVTPGSVTPHSVTPGPVPPAAGEPLLTELYDSLRPGSLRPDSLHTPGIRVQANMVTSIDGRLRGADGLSGSISSAADKRVFSVLRALADAVVVGAHTIRTERYTRLHAKPGFAEARAARSQQPAPTLVIVTNSGDLDIDRLNSAGTGPVVVHVGAAASPATYADLRAAFGQGNVISHPDGVSPQAVLTDLAGRGHARVLHEGGPTLLGQWVAAGVVDELCLTVTPYLQGAPHEGNAPALLGQAVLPTPAKATVRSVLTDGATMLYRWGLHAS